MSNLTLKFIILFVSVIGNRAWSDCTVPAGVVGQYQWVSADSVYKYCDGTNWISTGITTSGTACTNAGELKYIASDLTFCNGANLVSTSSSATNGSCAGVTAGTFHFNYTSVFPEWCDGTNWIPMVKIPPTTNVIAADRPLMVSTSTGSGTYVAPPAGPSFTPGAAGVGSGDTSVGTGITPSGTAVATTGTGAVGNAPTAISGDATISFTATITETANFPVVATQACSVLAPFTSLTCAFPSFPFASADMTSGTLQTKAYSTNGSSADFLNSNTLPVVKYVVKQISNTRNDNTLPDTPIYRTTFNNKLFYNALNAGGTSKVFTYDGTTLARFGHTAGETSAESMINGMLQVCNGYLYYNDRTPDPGGGSNGRIFAYDGTTYTQVSNTSGTGNTEWNGVTPTSACYNNKYHTMLMNANGVGKLFSISGISAPVQVSNITGNAASGDGASSNMMIVYNSALYFAGNNATLRKIYSWNGTTLSQFSNTRNGTHDFGTSYDPGAVVYNGYLFHYTVNSAGAGKLYKSDGTTTTLISATDTGGDDITNLFVHNSKLYFSASNTSNRTKLFEYDDIGGTLKQISNTANAAGTNDAPANLTTYNSKLFFTATNASGFVKLYSYDGTTLKQISNTAGSGASDAPTSLTVYNNRLFFGAVNPSGVTKLYVYDDVYDWLAQVSNTSGSASVADTPSQLAVLGTRLYFRAFLTATASKLFRICDTSAGCSD